MAYDPVLDREMFRPKAKSKGLEDLRDSEDPAVIARREQALAMMETAKQKFDPSNYQTLGEQDRPGVFRPVAVNMPAPQPTVDTATRMQQLANMGMRPIGMAKGGLPLEGYSPYEMSQFLAQRGAANLDSVKRNYDLPSYNEENISPTISSDNTESDDEYFNRLARLRRKLREIEAMPVKQDPGKATFDIEDTTATINPETGLPAPSGDIYPNQPASPPPSRKTLRPERSWWESFNPGKSVDEWTEKKIEERAAAAPLPKVIKEGQYVRPEYAPTMTRQDRARKEAESAGIVTTPAASTATTGTAQTSDGVASLVGSGRGTAEKPGQRKAYEDALIAKNRASGGKPAGATDTTSTGAAHPTNLSDIKRDRDDAFNMALMQAGLAMMAGRSSNALTNIGEGGIAGLQAYANQLAQSRARGLEERKLDMMEKYYGSREKALEAAGIRHLDAMNRIKLDAMKAADAAVATELKANPTMAKRDADLLRQQTYDRYMSAIANNAEFTSSAPELNPEATSILGD